MVSPAIKEVLAGPRLGIGCLSLAGETRPPRDVAVSTVRWAIENGVPLLDTADCYGVDGGDHGYSEEIISQCLDAVGRSVLRWTLLTTKGGLRRGPNNTWIPNGCPDYIRTACRSSLQRLGIEQIGLYQLHRPDPNVPYEDSVGALQKLREEGLIAEVGVSNVDDDLLNRALGTGPIASVQNAFGLLRQSGRSMVDRCAALGIPYIAWGSLGGRFRSKDLAESLPGGSELARSVGLTIHELVLAWVLRQGTHIIVVPGAKSPDQVQSALRAVTTDVSKNVMMKLEETAAQSTAG